MNTMLLAGKELLTPKEMAYELGLTSTRAVRDFRKEFSRVLKPVDFLGLQPLYERKAFEAAKAERLKKRLKQIGAVTP